MTSLVIPASEPSPVPQPTPSPSRTPEVGGPTAAAKQRKRDHEEQATRAVQRDVLANAAKRARTEVAKFSGANLSGAYAAAAYGAWLRSQGSTEPAEPAVVPRPEPADAAAERVHAAGG